MNIRRIVARTISETVALTRCMPHRQGWRVLMYHAIGTPALGDRLGLFSIRPALFRAHVAALAAWPAGRVVPFAPAALTEDTSCLSITFDDGYLDNLEVAAPALVEHRLPFTVFVTADFVRSSRPGFLTPQALRELAALPGVQIGAHGDTHVALTECDADRLTQELRHSRHYLEDAIGQPVTTMAYPYGAANRRVRAAAAAAGYTLAACSHADLNAADRDPLLLARTEITAHDSVRVLKQKLGGYWDWYRFRTQDPAVL